MKKSRLGILLAKELLHGLKSYIIVFAVAAPIIITIIISLVLGTWMTEKPRLGILDMGSTQLALRIRQLEAIENIEYSKLDEMKKSVENGAVDMALVIPADFDSSVRQGNNTQIEAYIWGESKDINLIIIGTALTALSREIAGQKLPLEIESINLGQETGVSWGERLLPFIVLTAVFLGGVLLPSTSIAVEKERKTMRALLSAPVSAGEVFLAKGIVGFILSFIMGTLILILNNALGPRPLVLIPVLALGGIMAAELGVLLGVYAKDFTTIFTIWKSVGIILFAPGILHLFPQVPDWISKVFPTHYVIQPVIDLSRRGGGWPDISLNVAILIAIDAAIALILLLVLRRKQGSAF